MPNYTWKATSHTPISKHDLTIAGPSPITKYTLPPEELERYRSMPPPIKDKDITTTARQYLLPRARR